MRVKIISDNINSPSTKLLEEEVNEFLENKTKVEVQWKQSSATCDNNVKVHLTAIIYYS